MTLYQKKLKNEEATLSFYLLKQYINKQMQKKDSQQLAGCLIF